MKRALIFASAKIVLPAMQRPFVWKSDRITRLIDSLLRGFPLGTALLWKTSTMQRFRRFQSDIQPDAGITHDFESGNSSEKYLVLDGQQRLTSLFAAISGTYEGKRLFLNVLSGERRDKDPGDEYWDCRFLTEAEARELNAWPHPETGASGAVERTVFVRFQDLIQLEAAKAGLKANKRASELGLNSEQTAQIARAYLQCATALSSRIALQVHLIDEDPGDPTPIDEILEVFVRVNSGGLVLQKSDLLMSLLDLKWNDIQPELYRSVAAINQARPFNVTRDDILKSLLLANGCETRFDKLVGKRGNVEALAEDLPRHLPAVEHAWRSLTTLLMDECKISSERFFRGGHNSLLPFVQHFVLNPNANPAEKRRLVAAVYLTIMSGVFAGAEARMGRFTQSECARGKPFPFEKLARLVTANYGIKSLEELLSRHLDLALNIAHGGVSLDNNPENLQRDHIFPRATLLKDGVPLETANHYANFHFLRGTDNLNKSDTPPHEWFKKPGVQPAYTDDDLRERLLSWNLLQPGMFSTMLARRSEDIRARALKLFGFDAAEFDRILSGA
jgi:hypothetical protein